MENTIPNAGIMLGQRHRRRANIIPTLGECLLFAGFGHGNEGDDSILLRLCVHIVK